MVVSRFVSEQQIFDARFPIQDVYDLVLEGFILHSLGDYEMPPKQGVHTRARSFMHAMPAYLPTRDLAGTKLISVYPGNSERGLDPTTGIIVMMDPDTGIMTDTVDARWATNTRTAMVSMVDTRFLAKAKPVFGIIGATGNCGRAHIEAIATIFPGSTVIVNSRSQERCEDLVRGFEDFPCELIIGMNQEAVVKECDVLIVCTSYLPQPIFKAEWLSAGQNVLNIHARGWPANITSFVDRVSCDDRRQLVDPTGGITDTYSNLDADFELGEVVAGAHPGRESEQHTILSFNYGLAIFDILVADYILRNI